MYCRNFTVLSSFFDVKKQRPTMNLEKCYQYSANIEISLDLKVYFFLVTCKINNLIALRPTNQITEIFAPWWLFYELEFTYTSSNSFSSAGSLKIQYKFFLILLTPSWSVHFWSYLQINNCLLKEEAFRSSLQITCDYLLLYYLLFEYIFEER